MMNYVYLVLSVLCGSVGGIFGAVYNRKNEGEKASISIYNLFFIATAFLCWTFLYIAKFSFEPSVLLYAVPMGICFAAAVMFNLLALKYGPVSLSSLFFQLSLIGVTIWGFFFWKERATVFSITGLCLCALSIVLCLYEKKTDGKRKKKVTIKWLICALISCVANAVNSILQKTQQMRFDGEHSEMLMFFAMAVGLIAFIVVYCVGDKTNSKKIIKETGAFPIAYGMMNVALNLCVIILATSELPSSLVYPSIAVGGIAINSLFSFFAFKERLSFVQWTGVVLGAAAVVFLSV